AGHRPGVPNERDRRPCALARIFHQPSAAARDRAASTALPSVAVLDVLPSTPAGGSRRAPCIYSPLIAPRCDRGATSGLPAFLTLLRLRRAIDPCLLRCAGPGGHPPCSTYCSNTPPRASQGAPRCLRFVSGGLSRVSLADGEKCRLDVLFYVEHYVLDFLEHYVFDHRHVLRKTIRRSRAEALLVPYSRDF